MGSGDKSIQLHEIIAQHRVRGLTKTCDCEIGLLAQPFRVAACNKDRSTTCGAGAVDIAPPVADDVTAVKIDFQLGCRPQDQTRPRLATTAWVAKMLARVVTNLDTIKPGKSRLEFGMHCFDNFAALRATADIRLVRHHDEQKSRRLEPGAAIRHIIIKLKFFYAGWRMGKAIAEKWPVQNAIAIQKDRRSRYFVLSHFVSAILRAGCEVQRCHTTDWNASACGVTLVELTVGIMIATSATRAV